MTGKERVTLMVLGRANDFSSRLAVKMKGAE